MGLALCPPSLSATGARTQPTTRILGTRRDAKGSYHCTGFDPAGRIWLDVPLPDRAHGIAVTPDGRQAAVFSRRPGDYLFILDLDSGRTVRQQKAAPGRFFNGHGVFIDHTLYVSETSTTEPESRYPQGTGLIGVYDATQEFRRVAEFASHGLDPHDIRAVDSNTLVVANGGLLTHPDAPRVKLNLATMQPSIAYLDAKSGHLISSHQLAPELHQLSIRHLAITADQTVVVAMQYEGPSMHRPPLVAFHRQGESALRLQMLPESWLASMRNYCGSVAVDADGTHFAISSPRGGCVLVCKSTDGAPLHTLSVADGCGIAPDGQSAGFIISSGLGGMFRTRAQSSGSLIGEPFDTSHWDNHLTAISSMM